MLKLSREAFYELREPKPLTETSPFCHHVPIFCMSHTKQIWQVVYPKQQGLTFNRRRITNYTTSLLEPSSTVAAASVLTPGSRMRYATLLNYWHHIKKSDGSITWFPRLQKIARRIHTPRCRKWSDVYEESPSLNPSRLYNISKGYSRFLSKACLERNTNW
jgi:hypothetical protein